MRRWTVLAALVAVLSLFAAACGGDDDTGTGAEAGSATTATPGDGLDGLPAELRFSAPTVAGNDITGDAFVASPTLFWFWAPW